MSNRSKLLLGTALCVSVCLSAWAETEMKTFNKPSDWQPENVLSPSGDTAMKAEISKVILSKEMISLNPDKTYFLSGCIKVAEGSSKGKLYYGFRIYDAKGKQLLIHHCSVVKGTDTELLEATEPTDTSIIVKDASKWKCQSHLVIAYNTKPDRSDLPNKNILSVYPKKIEQTKDGWVIHLNNAVNTILPAGTKIREHSRGGEFYYGLGNDKKPIELKKSRIWWLGGVSKVRVLINAIPAERGKKMQLDLSGLELEIRENKKK